MNCNDTHDSNLQWGPVIEGLTVLGTGTFGTILCLPIVLSDEYLMYTHSVYSLHLHADENTSFDTFLMDTFKCFVTLKLLAAFQSFFSSCLAKH